MHAAYSVAEIRAAEEPLVSAAARRGDPDAVMRRAAAGVAAAVRRELRLRTGGLYGRRVLLLVGSGDNGGDALYAGVDLRRSGVAVDAALLGSGTHERALAAFRRVGGKVCEVSAEGLPGSGPPDLAVDGIVGLGGRGPVRAPAAETVERLRDAAVPIVAVDLPSGVDADSGIVHEPSVRATATVTFGALRRAHLLASPACGRVDVVDIGLDLPGAAEHRLGAPSATEVADRWPIPGPADDKYSQGVVAIRAGSSRYPGAAVLSAAAAVAATSGMVRYCGSAADAVLGARPEIVATADVGATGTAQAWAAGPGMGTGADAVADLDAILGRGVPTLLDADALTCVAEFPALLRRRRGPVVLTPHAGEFARLTGRELGPESDRSAELRACVERLRAADVDATVLLKGRVTLIDDGARQFAVDAGGSWAATAGSGDVLTGILGALLAARVAAAAPAGTAADPARAAADGAVLHAAAARRAARRPGGAGAPIGATDLVNAVPETISHLRGKALREETTRPWPRGLSAAGGVESPDLCPRTESTQ